MLGVRPRCPLTDVNPPRFSRANLAPPNALLVVDDGPSLAFEVVELPAARGGDERDADQGDQQQAQEHEEIDDVHRAILRAASACRLR